MEKLAKIALLSRENKIMQRSIKGSTLRQAKNKREKTVERTYTESATSTIKRNTTVTKTGSKMISDIISQTEFRADDEERITRG